MARATNAPASRERRKKVVDKARGFRGRRSKLFRYAKDAVYKAQYWATRDRKTRKRNFRRLWIVRINAACRMRGLRYGQFIAGLLRAQVELNRKTLANLAVHDPETFTKLVELAKANLPTT